MRRKIQQIMKGFNESWEPITWTDSAEVEILKANYEEGWELVQFFDGSTMVIEASKPLIVEDGLVII